MGSAYTVKPTIAGICLMISTITLFFIVSIFGIITGTGDDSGIFIGGIGLIISLPIFLIMLVGSIGCFTRRFYWIAIIASIIGIGGFFGLASLILLATSSDEF